MTQHRTEDLCKILTKNIGKSTEANKKLQLHMEASDFHPKDFNDWFKRVREEMTRVYQAVLTCREYGLDPEGRKEHKGKEKQLPTRALPNSQEVKQGAKRLRDPSECMACGRQHHASKDCHVNHPDGPHPDVNTANEPWAQSAKEKAWKAKGDDVLPFTKTLSGEA